MFVPIALTVACLLSVVALLVVDKRESELGRAVFKQGASTCFVLVAVALGAWGTTYGRWMVIGLVLGWIGDAFLLGRHPKAFLGGLGAFLLAHVAYAVGFLSGPVAWNAVGVAALIAALLGVVIMRWLWPHVGAEFKVPVLAYVLTILVMCVLAAGSTFATSRWLPLVGAVLFAASDISVARDRFVVHERLNRLWGWPVYFVSQLLLAWSVI